MMTKTKTALVVAFILGSASAAMAQASGEELEGSQYLRNPNAPVPMFQQHDGELVADERGPFASSVIEGRNVYTGRGVRQRRVYEGRNVYEGRGASNANRHPIESFGGY